MKRLVRFWVVSMVLGLGLLSCSPSPTLMPTPVVPTPTALVSTPTMVRLTDTPPPTVPPLTPTAFVPTPTKGPSTDTPSPTATSVPVRTPEATGTPLPPTVPAATVTPTEALPETPDPAVGKQLWPLQPCRACHGIAAQGDSGPRLAGTGLSFDQVLARVRLGKGQMPAFGEDSISEQAIRHIYAWLRSLAPPTPTPPARPSFPTQALMDMWHFVNEMRIRADFATDLPARQATDDAGRLKVVKDYAGDGLAQVQQVLDKANQALQDVPKEDVKTVIREVIRETNIVADHFNQALARNSYSEAWAHVAEAQRICRIDTLPWATQAVRDAGLVGTVRIRVVNQAGSPIAGALSTVLTAHTPLGSRVDGSGRVTFVNVAAVPALPTKAYAQGRVYHEVNVNLSPGSTVDATIVLPPLPPGNVAPRVSDASINPASGPGNATLQFGLTATDPQGRLNLAQDQIFALNTDLGLAYVLLHAGGDRYEAQETLPSLPAGLYTWHFFAVDHECNTSDILDVRYKVE